MQTKNTNIHNFLELISCLFGQFIHACFLNIITIIQFHVASVTWQPDFSNIFAYSTVFCISSNTLILHVTGTDSFLAAKLTANTEELKILKKQMNVFCFL